MTCPGLYSKSEAELGFGLGLLTSLPHRELGFLAGSRNSSFKVSIFLFWNRRREISLSHSFPTSFQYSQAEAFEQKAHGPLQRCLHGAFGTLTCFMRFPKIVPIVLASCSSLPRPSVTFNRVALSIEEIYNRTFAEQTPVTCSVLVLAKNRWSKCEPGWGSGSHL